METKNPATVRVGPGEGKALRMPGAISVTRKIGSEQTGGAYSLFDVEVAPGGGEAPHVQHREDECIRVIEGRFDYLGEDGRFEIGPGDLIYVPRGDLHAYTNVGATTGRLLMLHTPGGPHERFFDEVGDETASESALPDLERLAGVAAGYGIEICRTNEVSNRERND